jgi:hypothetical protein
MNQHDRSKILRSKRGNALRDLAGSLIVDPDMLPTKSELRASIEELYPGDGHEKLRTVLYEKLTKVAEEAQNRKARFVLRGVVDELVIQVEEKLATDDRIVPAQEQPTDEEIAAATEKALDPYADEVGGELRRKADKERDEAREILRKAGYVS